MGWVRSAVLFALEVAPNSEPSDALPGSFSVVRVFPSLTVPLLPKVQVHPAKNVTPLQSVRFLQPSDLSVGTDF
jgi:hypothetical protein